MTTAIMACLPKQAMFVTEWVAYHRLILFDKVFVSTNDCSNGTDTILDCLEALGQVIHIRNDEMHDLAPQPAGVKRCWSILKTMFRPNRFRTGIDHMQKQPVTPDIRLCNARGRSLNPAPLYDPISANLRFANDIEVNRNRHFGWGGAQINHYAVRTQDLFLMKNVRGDGTGSRHGKRYFLNSRWYRAANRNETEDRSILRHLKGLKSALAELRKDKGLKLLESMALKRFNLIKAEHLTPENIRAWTSGEAA